MVKYRDNESRTGTITKKSKIFQQAQYHKSLIAVKKRKEKAEKAKHVR